uniref:Uncharacterized protein n=1 Tax=Oryza barthii TaxID=65489 RepID=A0A0D3GQ88_9ORYZ
MAVRRAAATDAWLGSCPPANYRDSVVLEDGAAVLQSRLAGARRVDADVRLLRAGPQGPADQPPARPPGPRQGLHRRPAHHGAFTYGELDLMIGDAEGRRYGLTCGYSDYAMCYRLFGAAGEFGRSRANNREVRDVAVGKDKLMKVFTFRSPALRPV